MNLIRLSKKGSTQKASRRRFISSILAIGLASTVASSVFAAPKFQEAQKIADHFASIKTMTGEFVQFGPRGEQTGGKFFIERPGKIRFNYEDPSPMRVIADGRSVIIGNRKLNTWQLYPLSKTPLALLLSETIDLNGKMVRNVKEDPDLTTIVLGDKSIFGDSTITMMFDPASFDLRQWTITDAQGKDTSVMIFNVKTGVGFDNNVFEIPYDKVNSRRKSTR